MAAPITAVGGSVEAHSICNQRVTGSNPVTVILRTSVLWIFLIFKIKRLTLPPFARCLARSEEATQDAIMLANQHWI